MNMWGAWALIRKQKCSGWCTSLKEDVVKFFEEGVAVVCWWADMN